MPSLLDNTIANWTEGGVGWEAGYFGQTFQVSVPCLATGIRWYYHTAEVSKRPIRLSLWRKSDSFLMHDDGGFTIPGSAGWTTEPIDNPKELLPDTTYIVAFGAQNSYRPQSLNSPIGPPPYPFKTSDISKVYATGWACPQTDWGVLTGVDIVVVPQVATEPADPPLNEPATGSLAPGSSLSYWLSTETQNPHSAPKQTLDVLSGFQDSAGQNFDDLRERIIDIAGQVANIRTDQLVADALAAAGFEGIANFLSSWSPAAREKLDQAADATIAWLTGERWATKSDVIQGPGGSLPPGASWVSVGGAGGNGPSRFTTPADMYILEVTNPESRTVGMTIDGLPYFLHRGWWAVCNGDVVGSYNTFVGIKTQIHIPGYRLPGLIFYVDPDLYWSITAYDYVPDIPGEP
jgi:hypothetical protein